MHRGSLLAVLLVAGSMTACDGGGTAAPAAPTDLASSVVTAAPLTTVLMTSTTLVVETTVSPTTVADTVPPTVTVPVGAPVLSPDGPWTLVASAPGINSVGLVYELMPKLWVFLPTQEDRPNGYFWTFNELDRPAIEGYLKAMLTRYRSTDSVPATLDDEGWDLYYTPESAAALRAAYQAISDQGEFTDLDLGVVLRPKVIEDERTDEYTIVLDCVLDGAVRRNADGSYAARATPGVVVNGYSAGMRMSGGGWRLDGFNNTGVACA